MSPVFSRIAIIGVGLIGSSIARAARAYNAAGEIALYDSDSATRETLRGLDLGIVCDQSHDAVAGAALVMMCAPVGETAQIAQEIGPVLEHGAIVSDVGSVKSAVVASAGPHLPAHAFFVPGHPIAGTENSGPQAGFAHLFQGRWQILTPLEDTRADYLDAVKKLEAFWRMLGSDVEMMSPAHHDVVLAATSHLPHLIAYNIVAMAEDLEHVTESEIVKYSASGFRDFTRIAASDPVMWRDVFLNNREAVLELLSRFSEDLAGLQKAIRWNDGEALLALFTRARRMRREVIEAGQESAAPNWGRDTIAKT